MIKLEKISITGYKGISERVDIPAKEFNVIVGKNDAGKSTILKALDLFLNNKQYISENLNNQTSQFTQIELFFSPNNTLITIDENSTTTFEQEDIINEDGLIHIIKRWDGTKTGKISPEYFIVRKSFNDLDYFSLTEAKLIKLCQDNGLDAESGLMTNPLTGEEHNNVEKRQRLKEIYIEREFEFEFIQEKLPTSRQTRLKKTELALKTCLPRFEYFLADSPLSESDSTIQKYFKDMAFNVIKDEVDTDELENMVKVKLQTVLNSITGKINSVVPENEQVNAKINFDWSKLITTSFESDGQQGSVPLSARGDGFRRITMMSYFEHLAEERNTDHQNIIFGFEEPETFLHPSAQENLFQKLADISSAGYQVFITTHSPVLVSKSQKEDLHHVAKVDGVYKYNHSVENYNEIAEDLGITVDNQFVSLFDNSKCLLLLEGIDDCNAFIHISNIYFDNGAIPNKLEDIGIALVPVGGCGSIKHWVSLDLLRTLNKKFYIFLDSDKTNENESSKNTEKLIEYGFIEGSEFSVSRKREIENYMLPSALERIIPDCSISFTDWCDVKKVAKDNPKMRVLGASKIASKHFTSLTYADLKATFDPTGEDDEFLELYEKLVGLTNEA